MNETALVSFWHNVIDFPRYFFQDVGSFFMSEFDFMGYTFSIIGLVGASLGVILGAILGARFIHLVIG